MKNLLLSFNSPLAYLIISIMYLSMPLYAQQWSYTGHNMTNNVASTPSLVTDRNGTPCIAYGDYKATVRRYDGSSWAAIGDTSFSDDASYVSLAFDNANTPYVVFEDFGHNNKATVMTFNGTQWVTVGQVGFSDSAVVSTSIAIDPSGTPYVAYQNNNMGGTIAVKKYTGGAWVNVGALLPPSYSVSNIAIDGTGTPYIAFCDVYNVFGFMRKFDGSNWVSLGPFFSDHGIDYPSIAIDHHDVPYVACEDQAGGATVMKYANGAWDTLGYPNFNYSAHSGAKYVSLVIASNDTPYIAFQDGATLSGSQGKAVAAKFTGSGWSEIGGADITFGEAENMSIAVNGSGVPYVAFEDYSYSRTLSVMKYGAVTGISEAESVQDIAIAPNPARNVLRVSLPTGRTGKLILMDMAGQVLSIVPTTRATETVDMESMSSGMYILS